MHFQPLFRVFISAVLFVSALEAARPLCTAKNCASYNKRDALTRYQRDASLVEATPLNSRTLDQPADENKYVTDGVNGLSTSQKIYNDNSKSVRSTTLFKNFQDKNGGWVNSFEIGLKKLTGCITVVIISRTAVYAAHFFEDTSMNSLDTANYASNLLQSGSTGKGKKFDSISSHISDLNSSPYENLAFPEVFIITPVKSNEDPVDVGSAPSDTRPASVIGYDAGDALQYSQQTADIVSEIRSVWPGSNRIHQVVYYPLNSQNKKTNQMRGSPNQPDATRLQGSEGKVLFEYDKSQGISTARLWVEYTKKFEWQINPITSYYQFAPSVVAL